MGRQGSRDFAEEYVDINGIKQYFLHYPAANSEVMLVIHGGPGQSEAAFAYYVEPQDPSYTAVYYDQRGAGKTLRKNPTDGSDVTFQTLFEDLAETVRYLKQKYQRDKIIIQGHSWGSVLGLLYAHQHPEDVLFYVGAGQVVDYIRGERIILEELKRLAAGDSRSYRALEKLEDRLLSAKDFLSAQNGLMLMKIKKKYGLGIDFRRVSRIAMKSPVFGLADMLAMIKAQKLIGQLYDFLSSFSALEITEFKIPVYCIHGKNDGQVPLSLAKEYLESLTAPDKGFYQIANAGHICSLDNPIDCHAAIKSITGRFGSMPKT
ncbi:MAG: alpha/beta hydrolase [Coriobacteriales bacterium]|nr:alpha/beta hydrolase [Coriobacteriales bacterium]